MPSSVFGLSLAYLIVPLPSKYSPCLTQNFRNPIVLVEKRQFFLPFGEKKEAFIGFKRRFYEKYHKVGIA